MQKNANSSARRKGTVYGIIAVMLVLAVYLNWSYVETPDELIVANQTAVQDFGDSRQTDQPQDIAASEVVSGADYFAESRLTREKARDEAISILKDSLQSEDATAEQQQIAAEKISRYADHAVAEARIEGMIKAKGYPEAVVYIGEEGVDVIVQPKGDSLGEDGAVVIRDIVTSETVYAVSQIRIVEAAV